MFRSHSLPIFFCYVLGFSSDFFNVLDARKNGAVVGAVYKDMKGPLFPTIAVHSQNEEYVFSRQASFIFHQFQEFLLHGVCLYFVSLLFSNLMSWSCLFLYECGSNHCIH